MEIDATVAGDQSWQTGVSAFQEPDRSDNAATGVLFRHFESCTVEAAASASPGHLI